MASALREQIDIMRQRLDVIEDALDATVEAKSDELSAIPLLKLPPKKRAKIINFFNNAKIKQNALLAEVYELQNDADGLAEDVMSRLSQLHRAECPIGALPPEIMSYIFLYVAAHDLLIDFRDGMADDESARVVLSVISLSHVCRAWRKAVINQTPLWCHIVLPMPQRYLELYIKHSRDQPIDLTICADPKHNCDPVGEGYRTVWDSVHPAWYRSVPRFQRRIRSLTMHSENWDRLNGWVTGFFEKESGLGLPSLQTISLQEAGDALPSLDLSDLGPLPSLSSLQAFNVVVADNEDLLEVLHLDYMMYLDRRPAEILDDLGRYSCLETLRLSINWNRHKGRADTLGIDTDIYLPRLRQLELDDFEPCFTAQILPRIVARGAERLVLSGFLTNNEESSCRYCLDVDYDDFLLKTPPPFPPVSELVMADNYWGAGIASRLGAFAKTHARVPFPGLRSVHSHPQRSHEPVGHPQIRGYQVLKSEYERLERRQLDITIHRDAFISRFERMYPRRSKYFGK